jgi:hypothetical protein
VLSEKQKVWGCSSGGGKVLSSNPATAKMDEVKGKREEGRKVTFTNFSG